MICALVTSLMLRKYESSVVLEVKPRGRPIPQKGVRYGDLEILQAEKIQETVFEAMVSRECLVEVSQALDLPSRWQLDEEAVLEVLRKIITTKGVRGTDLIQISVRHSERESARDIAEKAVFCYIDYRVRLETGQLKKAIEELRNAIREQKAKVERTREKIAGIKMVETDPTDREVHARRLLEAKGELLRDQATLAEMLRHMGNPAPVQTDDSFVIHEPAVLADRPVSPNASLNLVCGAVGGLLISPFLALPLMWMMNRKSAV